MKFSRLLAIILVFLMSFSATAVFASEEDDVKKLLDNDAIVASDDYYSVNAISSSSADEIQSIMEFDRKLSFKDENYFKVYQLESPDIVKYYKSNKEKKNKFRNNITDEYTWVAPIYQDDNAVLLATFVRDKENGKDDKSWILAGFSDGINTDALSFFTSRDAIEDILFANGIKKANEIKLVFANRYYTNIIYIRKGNEEYGVPFSNNPEAIGLVNGKLYEMSEIIDTLKENVPTDEADSGEKSGGGFGTNRVSGIKIISILVMVLACGLLLVVHKDSFLPAKN